MLEQLLNHIDQHQLCKREDKIVLAISGGIDSMVLLHLFQRAGFSIAVAHCNFQLRGKESDEEETFVKDFCAVSGITFHLKKFDTTTYAEANGLSVQVAARELRYNFFDEVLNQYGYRYVATAHHHNDNIETVLIHLLRGTGMDGLTGIPVKNRNVIRPLLFATREAIAQYAIAHNIDWREDSSNQSDDYQRNFLRHNIIPLLKNINPNLEEGFKDTLERIQGAKALAGVAIDSIKKNYFNKKNDEIRIDKNLVSDFPWAAVLLWEALKEYGFLYVQCKQITGDHQTGKKFYSSTHQLTVDRDCFILTELMEESEVRSCTIHADETTANLGRYQLYLNEIPADNFTLLKDSSVAQLDAEKIQFPLTWRFWRSGDSFHPLGMDHTKKLSDFLIDQKIPLPRKEHVTVIESGDAIVWVAGMRIDERFKVSGQTRRVLVVKLYTHANEE